MDRQEEYRKRMISAEEAVEKILPGNTVAFTAGREAYAIGLALVSRIVELQDQGVKVFVPTPGYDFGWYDAGWENFFDLTIMMATATCQNAIDERRIDFNFGTIVPFHMNNDIMAPDILITELSPPDEKGFCSFGQSLWNKKRHIRAAKLVIAEVNPNLIKTYGDNFIHVSEIDYFVEHISSGAAPGTGSLAGRKKREPEPYIKDIAGYVGSIMKDRDTFQIGVGRTTELLVQHGLLDAKHGLGYHSEATPPGIITLVQEGVITGKYKTLNPGKVTVTSLGGGTKKEMAWASDNPIFELVDVAYLEDIRVIAAHDNMVAINQALAIELTGQITAEGFGTRQVSVAGGQIPFVFGALLSKGGRSITVLPSTVMTANGPTSRIMPTLPEGTPITTLRNCAQYIVTEYGIANLWGKSVRQRAGELISIAHPDFRSELRAAAKKRFWP
ncbi:MAG: acetyl-CoA hydrolase/transferase C-terminal domain-containing protein [Syntrophales bacterium]|nr:acetyl-CoA hydrolase/transferase C-terminal domain-containing protein [Syntrophales bacterium]